MMNSEKLIVALDVPTFAEAAALVKKLSPVVKIFKVGKELFTACGPEVVKMVNDSGARVFLDLKFHDIPNTVASASKTAAGMNVFMLNVHASGGSKMMSQASKALHEYCADRKIAKPILIGVTVLTSMSEEDLGEVGVRFKIEEQVLHLARLAKQSGLDGVVASPKETRLIRENLGKDFIIVTPGVRPAWAEAGDQKRIMTPKLAIEEGANFIVIGRPITAHADPMQAARKILEEINS